MANCVLAASQDPKLALETGMEHESAQLSVFPGTCADAIAGLWSEPSTVIVHQAKLLLLLGNVVHSMLMN